MTVFSLLRMPAFFRRVTAAAPETPLSLSLRLRWLLRRGIQHLGQAGVIAVGVLAMVLAFYFSAIVPARQRLDAARFAESSLRHHIGKASSAAAGHLPPAEQLAQFYRIFPAEKNSPLWLGKVFASASSRGLQLEQGEYDVKPEKVGRLVRFRMTLPVKGEYPRIRKFLTGLPTEVPVVAVEQVQFQRQKIGDPQVDAKLKLVLFLEKAR